MLKLLREPLIHFVLFGALVVLVDGVARDTSSSLSSTAASQNGGSAKVVVDDALLRDLRSQMRERLERLPTDTEFARAVDNWITDEVLVREAIRLGIDKGDPIVRRRLAKKMAWLVGARQVTAAPSQSDLRQLYDAHRDVYRLATQVTLRQIFISDPSHGSPKQAHQLQRRLQAGADPIELGKHSDPPPGGPVLRGRDFQRLSKQFGAGFVRGLGRAPTDKWLVRSSPKGWHVLRVVHRRQGRQLSFEECRARLVSRWQIVQAEAVRHAALNKLRQDVVIEGWPR